MRTYIHNVYLAVLLFPFLSALLSVPYAIYQYRKFGSISMWKTLLVFSFIFYLMCAYFMIILPLPEDRSIVVPGAQHPQLVPFYTIRLIASGEPLDPTSLSSWLEFLRRPNVYTVYFNVLLTLPFGVYLRYLFHRSWWQALIMGFGLSLFFELSQLTGLFGIYEHPYRLFDVDDLITNTFGTMLGFWISIPLCHFLPDLRDVDARAIERGAAHTSFTRRLLAFAIDMVATAVVLLIYHIVVPGGVSGRFSLIAGLLMATFVTFMVIPIITHGQTIGHRVLRLRIVRPDGSPARGRQYIARYGLLFWVFLLLPIWVSALYPNTGITLYTGADEISVGPAALKVVLVSVYVFWLFTVVVRAVLSAFKHPFIMLNGVISHTCVMSETQIERLRAERLEQGQFASERYERGQGGELPRTV